MKKSASRKTRFLDVATRSALCGGGGDLLFRAEPLQVAFEPGVRLCLGERLAHELDAIVGGQEVSIRPDEAQDLEILELATNDVFVVLRLDAGALLLQMGDDVVQVGHVLFLRHLDGGTEDTKGSSRDVQRRRDQIFHTASLVVDGTVGAVVGYTTCFKFSASWRSACVVRREDVSWSPKTLAV